MTRDIDDDLWQETLDELPVDVLEEVYEITSQGFEARLIEVIESGDEIMKADFDDAAKAIADMHRTQELRNERARDTF